MVYQPDLDRIRKQVAEGWISEEEHPEGGLFIFNYTQKCQFAKHWNDDTLNCRGLMLDSTGNIIARPFQKFFNYGERMPMPGTFPVEVTEKMDGSLGILYQWQGLWQVSTRGSFVSDQAKWATNFFQHLCKEHRLIPDQIFDPDLTLLFEIIYPENRVVVDYRGLQGLALIGARHKQTGAELYAPELEVIARPLHLWTPIHYTSWGIKECQDAAEVFTANDEGFVIRFSDNERYKIKSAAYLAAHRLMTGMSYGRVLKAVANGLYEKMIEGVPDEFMGQVKEWYDSIQRTADIKAQVISAAMSAAPLEDQKEFALWAQANYTKADQALLFAAKAGKDILPLIYRQLEASCKDL